MFNKRFFIITAILMVINIGCARGNVYNNKDAVVPGDNKELIISINGKMRALIGHYRLFQLIERGFDIIVLTYSKDADCIILNQVDNFKIKDRSYKNFKNGKLTINKNGVAEVYFDVGDNDPWFLNGEYDSDNERGNLYDEILKSGIPESPNQSLKGRM